jgi:hypothetical protein
MDGHSTSNNKVKIDLLIFRYVGESGVPLVRQMTWNFNKKIVAMDFNPTAQWLIIAAADCTIVLVPIYFLMCRKGQDFEEKTPQSARCVVFCDTYTRIMWIVFFS